MATCEERAGFLFSHACNERVADQCKNCSKGICQTHTHLQAGTVVCSSCAKKLDRKEQKQSASNEKGASERSDRRYRSHHRRSPYFYHNHYYGYGYYGAGYWGSHHMDRNDFTEADAESLTGDANEGFEGDVGGS
jgi:hypothetical protein